MLHVTNGDSAAHRLRAAGIPGDVLPWRDLLHEGPVPEGLDEARLRVARAGFVAALGWADEARVLADLEARDERLAQALASGEDIVLWFESDLYDLLQLVQILDRVAPARVRLVLAGEEKFTGVSELSDHELQDLLARGQPTRRARCPGVDRALVETARKMWAAFRAPDPTALAPLGQGTPALLALGEAVQRHLQQFPWRGSGLNRTERALLDAVAAGAQTPIDAFLAHQRLEERPFMGDGTALGYLRRLGAGRDPLLRPDALRLTEHGRAVLAGEREWEGRPERWLGGVRLPAGRSPWRYDPATKRVA